MKLNLGCGKDIKEGYINLDKESYPGINVKHDVDKLPLPFKDNYFDYIYCSRILEYPKDLIATMNDLIRISKPDAIIDVISPHAKSDGALKHTNFITKQTFEQFDDLEIIELRNICNSRFRKFIPLKKILSVFLWNIYDTIYLKLKVKK